MPCSFASNIHDQDGQAVKIQDMVQRDGGIWRYEKKRVLLTGVSIKLFGLVIFEQHNLGLTNIPLLRS